MTFHPGRSHGRSQDEATGGSLPCGRYYLAPLTGNIEGSKGLMVLRVKPIPTRFPSNSLYGLHTLAFYTKCVHPWGEAAVAEVSFSAFSKTSR